MPSDMRTGILLPLLICWYCVQHEGNCWVRRQALHIIKSKASQLEQLPDVEAVLADRENVFANTRMANQSDAWVKKQTWFKIKATHHYMSGMAEAISETQLHAPIPPIPGGEAAGSARKRSSDIVDLSEADRAGPSRAAPQQRTGPAPYDTVPRAQFEEAIKRAEIAERKMASQKTDLDTVRHTKNMLEAGVFDI